MSALLDSLRKKKLAAGPTDPVDVPSVEPPTPAPSYSRDVQPDPRDIQRIKDKHDKATLWAGATPLLMGLLAGGTGDAAEIAAEGMMAQQKAAVEEESDLMAFLRKRQISSDTAGGRGGRPVLAREGLDMPSRYVDPADAVGMYGPKKRYTIGEKEDYLRSKKDIVGTGITKETDPLTKKPYLLDKATGEAEQVQFGQTPTRYPRGWSKPEEDLVQSTVKEYNSKVVKNNEAMMDTQNGLNSLNSGELGTKLAVNSLVKKIEQRLSDQDRAFYLEPVSLLSKFAEKVNREYRDDTAPLRPETVKEAKQMLKEVARMQQGYSSYLLKSRVDQLKSATSARSGYLKKRFGKPFRPIVPKRTKIKGKRVRNLKEAKKLTDEQLEARIKALGGE